MTLGERVWALIQQGRLSEALALLQQVFPKLIDPRSLDPYGAYG